MNPSPGGKEGRLFGRPKSPRFESTVSVDGLEITDVKPYPTNGDGGALTRWSLAPPQGDLREDMS